MMIPQDGATILGAKIGVPPGPITALHTDLSSTLQADRLFLLNGPSPAILHLELESTGRLGIPDERLRYNVAARAVSKHPVHSIIMLLRPKANARDLTGYHEIMGLDNQPYLSFRYTVVRLWEQSVDSLLAAGGGISTLALLTNEAAGDLPGAFHRLRDRLRADGVPDNVEHGLLGSAYMLCGLRYTRQQTETLYRELNMILEDSTTYQFVLQKGRVQEAQSLILQLGTMRFGHPLHQPRLSRQSPITID